MHFYPMAAVCAGACLLCLAGALHFLERGFQWRDYTAVLSATTTIDADNPPKVLVQKLPGGGVLYSNIGGRAQHTPPPGFVSYDAEFAAIKASYWWLKALGTTSLLGGLALILGGVVGLLRFFLA